MEQEIRINHFIKLTGKAFIEKPLEVGKNYKVEIEGTITSETKSDNNDDSFDLSYKFEPVIVHIITEKGERIKAKDTRSRSQQLRSCIWRLWQENNSPIDFDKFYDEKMVEIIKAVYDGEV